MSRGFKYVLLSAFLLVLSAIVVLQFNANRSLKILIDGNEGLLEELNIKSNLQMLQTQIARLEGKVNEIAIVGKAADSVQLNNQVAEINANLSRLDSLRQHPTIVPTYDLLVRLVAQKIDLNKETFRDVTANRQPPSNGLINSATNKSLSDAISICIDKINTLHEKEVTAIINDADANGLKAKTSGAIVSILAAIAAIFSVGYVSYKIRQQEELIDKLNASEKKVREAAIVKENFITNMSHEIRTPLNAVMGFTNLLQRKKLDIESEGFIEKIHGSAEKLLHIINDILDLSKIESGMMRISHLPFDVRRETCNVVEMLLPNAREKNLLLGLEIDDDVPPVLEGDAQRLSQILLNLIGNALKFTEKGSVKVHITNGGTVGDEVKLSMKVGDTGLGIEKKYLQAIFERFHQAEESITRKYGGTGLGLSIVRDLVQLQNGTISVESAPGRGTSFTVVIPYKILHHVSLPPRAVKSNKGMTFSGADKKILVVEDNEMNRFLMRHILSLMGIPFRIVSGGNEALQQIQNEKFDLVLMDIQMPEMDGLTATRKLRDEYNFKEPIIAMTAHAMERERETCMKAGMDDYLPKPIDGDKLDAILSYYLFHGKDGGIHGAPASASNGFEVIDTGYLKELSGGDLRYEREVTSQFIEAVPQELEALRAAGKQDDKRAVKFIAHNFKTTVSVMGLDLNPALDALEDGNWDPVSFQKQFDLLQSVCRSALSDAEKFRKELN